MPTPPAPTSFAAYLAASQESGEDVDPSIAHRVLREARRRVAAARAADAQPRDCPRCGRVRTVADFGPNAARPDGLQSWCRDCRS